MLKSNNSISIRRLLKTDIDQLKVFFANEIAGFHAINDVSKYVDAIMGDFNQLGLVACNKEQIIGFASLLIELKFDCRKCLHVEDVRISRDYQSKGIGLQLVSEAIRIATREGCHKVSLACKETTLGFYEKLGFKPVGLSAVLYTDFRTND